MPAGLQIETGRRAMREKRRGGGRAISVLMLAVIVAGASMPLRCVAAGLQADEARTLLQRAGRWAIQLQGAKVDVVAASPADLVVIDYSADGSAARRYTAEEVARMQRRPDGGRRLLIAYFSIGEAETYRAYWHPQWSLQPPSFMGSENEDWPGNFRVRFWQRAWQDVLLVDADAYLDQLIAQGFDGVYLDRVDVYQDWLKERPAAGRDMIDFVGRIREAAHKLHPGFLIIGQNAEELLQNETYRRHLDAVAKEDLLFGVHGDGVANSSKEIAWSRRCLDIARRDGLPVFAIEYIAEDRQVREVRRQYEALGYRLYVAGRALDDLRPPAMAGRR